MANRRICIKPVVCFLEMLCVALMCFGQEEQDKKNPEKAHTTNMFDDYLPRLVFFYGNGINKQANPTDGDGSSNPQKLTNFGMAFEGGIFSLFEISQLGATEDVSTLNGFTFSTGLTAPMPLGKSGDSRFHLPLSFGYTRIIGTANAINFGAGLDVRLSEYNGIRFEVRDYLKLSGRKEHNVIFRIAFLRFWDD